MHYKVFRTLYGTNGRQCVFTFVVIPELIISAIEYNTESHSHYFDTHIVRRPNKRQPLPDCLVAAIRKKFPPPVDKSEDKLWNSKCINSFEPHRPAVLYRKHVPQWMLSSSLSGAHELPFCWCLERYLCSDSKISLRRLAL